MGRTKEYRIHQKKNKIRKAYKNIKSWDSIRNNEEILLMAKRTADNRHPCSCQMCRNPRHSVFYKGDARLTNQERRHAYYDEEDYDLEEDQSMIAHDWKDDAM